MEYQQFYPQLLKKLRKVINIILNTKRIKSMHTDFSVCILLCSKTERTDTMELKDTVALMVSDDYKDRFKAEYYQIKIRYEKLHKMIVKHEAGSLCFEPKCDIGLLKDQAGAMGNYLYALEVRAEIEGIEL